MRRSLLRAVNTTSLVLSLFRRWRDAIDPNIFEIYTGFHLVSAGGDVEVKAKRERNNSNT